MPLLGKGKAKQKELDRLVELAEKAKVEAESVKADAEANAQRLADRRMKSAEQDIERRVQKAAAALVGQVQANQVKGLYEGLAEVVARHEIPPSVIVLTLDLLRDSALREQRRAFKMDD